MVAPIVTCTRSGGRELRFSLRLPNQPSGVPTSHQPLTVADRSTFEPIHLLRDAQGKLWITAFGLLLSASVFLFLFDCLSISGQVCS